MTLIIDDSGNVTISGNLTVNGTLNIPAGAVSSTEIASDAAIARTQLAQESLAKFVIPLTEFRIHDALATALGATATSDDDLALVGGTFGSASPTITTTDIAGLSKTRRARVLYTLPPEYDASNDVQVRLMAGTVGGTADVSATIDVEAYESNKTGGVGSDLCATAAQSINSATFAAKDFVITASGLVAGDILDIRVTIAVDDTGGAGTLEAAFGSCEVLLDIRG